MVTPPGPHRQTEGRASRDAPKAGRRVRKTAGDGARRDVGSSDAAVTELHRAKAAAEAANEAKSRYLVAISHEIRSPLNAIYGYAQLLERGDAVTNAEAGAMIRQSVDHLTNLAESLLEISRIESGVLKIQSDVIDIRSLLEQVVAMFRAQALNKNLYVRLNLCANLPKAVKTDEKRLRQILINLVSNAIKYTETGGVEVDVRYRNQVATIQVIDTGIGIDPDDAERVFEPFERGRSSEARSQPGIGLGLTITRVLAWVMGGEIRVTGRDGGGSCFALKLMLPPAVSPVDAVPARRIESYRGTRRIVLIIEDDPAQSAALQSFLCSLDFIVFCAATGLEGVELAARYSPDLVLLDVQMPGIDGWETAQKLRRAYGQALKIVMMSAGTTNSAVLGRAGAVQDAFVAKPVHFDALLAAMQEQLGLQWNDATPDRSSMPERDAPSVPADARPYLRRIGDFARIGHVLGVEKEIAALDQAVPEAAPLASMLKDYARDFDFATLLQKIADVGER